MRYVRAVLLVAVLVRAGFLWAQSTPAPSPSCEQALEGQYRLLVSDKLLQDAPGQAWPQQLTAVVTQLRTSQTLYEVRKNQEELALKNVAQLLEQLRQAQQTQLGLTGENAALRQELEALKRESAERPKN